MAAGLGFKDFTTGEVLTAADVDGYLMQGIWVFDDATARDAAVTSPQEGNFAFLKDTNTTTYYTGSVWTNLDTTGMVNPMTTTGDTIYSSSGSTPARLGIGTAGQVLQVNSGATAPEWATPAGGGGITLLSTTSLTGSSTTISSISGSYRNLYVIVEGVYTSGTLFQFYINTDSLSNYNLFGLKNTTEDNRSGQAGSFSRIGYLGKNSSGGANTFSAAITIYNYATADIKSWNAFTSGKDASDQRTGTVVTGSYSGAAITEIKFDLDGSSFGGGTAKVYGVN
jgi:hypothetical protein